MVGFTAGHPADGELFLLSSIRGKGRRATERFLVLAGRVGFQWGTERSGLAAGRSCEVAPGTLHDWWQVGEDEAQVLVDVAPRDRFVHVVATLFGLARDRKVNAAGLPHRQQFPLTDRRSPAPPTNRRRSRGDQCGHPHRTMSIPDPAAAASTDQAAYRAFVRTAAAIDTRIRYLVPVLTDSNRTEVQP